MNDQLIARLLAFMAGVLLTASYFILTDNNSLPETSRVKQVTLQQASEIKQHSQQAVNLPSEAVANPTYNNPPTEKPSPEQLQAEVTQLEEQLTQQQSQIERYKSQLKRAYEKPSDLQQELQQRFEQESRNEQWAYNVETAVNDFLITADLAVTPTLKSGECKTTICMFELLAPENDPDFDHTTWRELNDKLIKQPWWQQFKMTTSQSSDGHYSFVVSTEA